MVDYHGDFSSKKKKGGDDFPDSPTKIKKQSKTLINSKISNN